MTNFEEEIEKHGYIVYTNEGDSMMPLLREHRDLLVIRKIEGPLRKYDTVLFKRPNGAYVLHRIVRVCGAGRYRIAGDNRYFSEIVPETWIFGILDEVIRDGEHISVRDAAYRAYVRRVPWHRLRLKISHTFHRWIGKIKRKFGRKKTS